MYNRFIVIVLSLIVVGVLIFTLSTVYNFGGWDAVFFLTAALLKFFGILVSALLVVLLVHKNRRSLLFHNYEVVENEKGIVTIKGFFRFGGSFTLHEFDSRNARFVTQSVSFFNPKNYIEFWDKDPERTLGFYTITENTDAAVCTRIGEWELKDKAFSVALRRWMIPRISSGLLVSVIDVETWEMNENFPFEKEVTVLPEGISWDNFD